MTSSQTISMVLACGLATAATDCSRVEFCDRYPGDDSCITVSDMLPPSALQVSPLRIPLPETPGTLKITLTSIPNAAQKIFIVQEGISHEIGSIDGLATTITPQLRSIVHPGPATIKVADQQVAVRLYVTPVFNQAVVQKTVNETGASTLNNPIALGVTNTRQIIMLAEYDTSSPFHGLKSYMFDGSFSSPDDAFFSAYTGIRFSTSSGLAVTADNVYFPSKSADNNKPTDIKKIDTTKTKKAIETTLAFSALSSFTAEATGQIIVAVTTDIPGAKRLTMFNGADASLNTSASIDSPPDANTLAILGAGDLDGDDIADLITWNKMGQASVYLGTDKTKVILKLNAIYSANLTAASKTLNALPAAISVGDIDGDQLSDFALIGSDGSLSLVLNEMNGAFSAPLSVTMPAGFSSPKAIAIGNVNNDPKIQSSDLVIVNNGSAAESKLIGVLVNQATVNWLQ